MIFQRRALWRLRLLERLPRLLVQAAAIAGLLASVRFAIAPPVPRASSHPRFADTPDLAAQGFASSFARAYLTWTPPGGGLARERALSPFVGGAVDAEAGARPAGGAQRVLWTEVVQQRRLGQGERVYTVAADTDRRGVLYLAVPVARAASGSLSLGGYPAFVGAPASSAANVGSTEALEVSDSALRTVVGRALRNYLASDRAELAADLTPGAPVSTPTFGFTLEALQSVTWAKGGGAVVAVLTASDRLGAHYTLAYEVNVSRLYGRWEVGAIEMDPDT